MVNSIQDPNPTPNFMATNDPLLLSTLIKSMGEMDLHAETDCFTAWLAKKAHQTASTNYTSNKLASPSINFQSKTTPAHYHHASHQHLANGHAINHSGDEAVAAEMNLQLAYAAAAMNRNNNGGTDPRLQQFFNPLRS